jgi:hypothetical protein
LMLGDLNLILDGLTELEDRGIETLDCRRAQFSAQEPIIRLRMICQSWKVMFQAEYSSGSPLRMLVDLRASVEHALGRGKAAEADGKAKPAAAGKLAVPAKPAAALPKPVSATPAKAAVPASKPPVPAAKAAAASAGATAKPAAAPMAKSNKPATQQADAPEFEVSSSPGWNPDSAPQLPKKK